MCGSDSRRAMIASRQGDLDFRPSGRMTYFDAASVGIDDALGNGHPQARALRFGRVKGIEDVFLLFDVHTRSGVADGDRDRRCTVECTLAGADRDLALFSAGNNRVLQNVPEDLGDGVAIHVTFEVASGLLAQDDMDTLTHGFQMCPRFAPDAGQVTGLGV